MLSRSFVGVVGATVVLLLAVTDTMAQSSCTSKTTSEGIGNFTASVTRVTTDQGRRQYRYTISPKGNKQPNKLFLFVHSSLANSITVSGGGAFVTPGTGTAFGGANDAWKVVSHESGAVWTNISTAQNPFAVEVPELAQPDATTTLVIGIGSTYEHCGPIFGPVAPPVEVASGPLVTTIAHLSFENGCSYFATVNLSTGKVTGLTPDPATPFETVGGSAACTADNNANCALETGLPFCGGNNVAQPPLQTEPGGICYYPNNIKFRC